MTWVCMYECGVKCYPVVYNVCTNVNAVWVNSRWELHLWPHRERKIYSCYLFNNQINIGQHGLKFDFPQWNRNVILMNFFWLAAQEVVDNLHLWTFCPDVSVLNRYSIISCVLSDLPFLIFTNRSMPILMPLVQSILLLCILVLNGLIH